MTWTRWWLTFILSTLAAVLVSIAAGDFDQDQKAAQRRAAIEQARRTSGVDGKLAPVEDHER
jgi:hypothetical protein